MEIRKEVLVLARATSKDKSRWILNCIALSANGQAAATDSYMAVLLAPTMPEIEPGNPMLLPRALTTIARKKPLSVEASAVNGRVALSVQYVDGGRLDYSLPRVEGEFPNVAGRVAEAFADPPAASIQIDPRYLRDIGRVLAELGCVGVVMELHGNTDPITFHGRDGEDNEVVALLMPMEYNKRELSAWLKDIVGAGAQKKRK